MKIKDSEQNQKILEKNVTRIAKCNQFLNPNESFNSNCTGESRKKLNVHDWEFKTINEVSSQ